MRYTVLQRINQRLHFMKKNISCKNNIGIIRNLEIKFQDKNYYNYNNITFIYILVIYITYERRTFKQRFKYQKNEKINLIKVILKLECFFYQNIYILFNLFLLFVEPFRLKQIHKVYQEKKKLSINLILISNFSNKLILILIFIVYFKAANLNLFHMINFLV